MLNMKQISKLKHICKNTRIIDPDTYYYDIFIPDSGLGDGKFKLIFCKYGSIHDYSKLLKKLLKKDEITDQVIHEDVFWASPNDTEYVNFVNISKFTPKYLDKDWDEVDINLPEYGELLENTIVETIIHQPLL